ncbi:MAG TPA: SRPBCC family protein [Candidatus Nitrosotalea sp.]|nr:SRPBCC family protein [Candidatus Nitrosotalea sp.]
MKYMVEIQVKIQIDAPIGKVWNIISQVDNDSEFWNLTKLLRNTSKKENEIVREIMLDKIDKCSQTITFLPKESVHVQWTKGVITGTKDISLTVLGSSTLLEAKMNYTISGPSRFFPEKLKEKLQIEAEYALDLIKEKSEGRPHIIPMEPRKFWADMIRG